MPYKDKKKRKEKAKEYSRKHYLKTREETKKRTKEWKEKNGDKAREHSKKRRRRIDPTIKIGDAIADLERRNIGHDEFVRRLERIINEVNEVS